MEIDWKSVNEECDEMEQDREELAREIVTQMAETWRLWTMAVLAEGKGPMRFSRIMEKVGGVSQKSLTKTLRQLERDGLATRAVFAEVPPRVEYTITALGLGMLEQVHPLWLWTVENLDKFVKARLEYDNRPETTLRNGSDRCGALTVASHSCKKKQKFLNLEKIRLV